MVAQNEDGFIKTFARESMKQYIVYDGSDRMITVYEARANAANGDPCLKTDYSYDGTSTRIVKMRESNAMWSSAYDI